MTEPNVLTVTDSDGGNARHAIGAHIVLVRADGHVLLGLRSAHVVLAASTWSTPPCGNLDAGESLRQAAAREADVQFFTPDEAAALLPDHERRRLRNALAARAGMLPSPDLENGHARMPGAVPITVENGAR